MAQDFDDTPEDVLKLFEGEPIASAKPRPRRGGK
jgi:hypothetical protein